MTKKQRKINKKIIDKALYKSIVNGFNDKELHKVLEKRTKLSWEKLVPVAYEYIIFSHSFAKAFWGEEVLFDNPDGEGYIGAKGRALGIAWKHHLQIMVLEEEPLKYIEKFL